MCGRSDERPFNLENGKQMSNHEEVSENLGGRLSHLGKETVMISLEEIRRD